MLKDSLYGLNTKGDSVLEFIKSNGIKYGWKGVEQAFRFFGKKAVFKAISKYTLVASIIFTACDAILGHIKQQSLDEFYYFLSSIDENSQQYLLLEHTAYVDKGSAKPSLPVHFFHIKLVDDLKHVSCEYDNALMRSVGLEEIFQEQYNYFGNISYIKDKNEVLNAMNSYFKSFDIFSWGSWIPD